MTMTKLANLAGCSLSTVSKAFSGSKEISEKTRNKIFEIAKENNCFNKFFSPSFQGKVFAIICNELSCSSVYGEFVEALNKRITDNGDTLIVSCNNFVSSVANNLLDYYTNYHKVDGLILIDEKKSISNDLKNIPVVSIGSIYNEKIHHCDCVNTDRSFGVYKAIEYFKKMGHRDIAFIGEYLTLGALKNFKKAMEDFDLTVNEDWIINSSKRMGEAGYDGMDRLISMSERPTAVFATYDAIAHGAMNRIYTAGLSVPDDFSVIGANNIPLTRFSNPPLTTVSTPVNEIADSALNLLYRRLRYPSSPYQSVSVQSELTVRQSVKKM
ncbi:MAG: LacI family DNA-binding transcriptional regulator [Clostridia bacterium]|nr:LacI family DNA-binding transcriptional regulator [Clostridia bacterium]